jgi:hypothetical protein
MKKSLFYFIVLLLYFPFALIAQNTKEDSLNWKANLSLTGFFQAGNVETLIFRAQSNLSIDIGSNLVYDSRNSYVYQEFGQVKADEDILSLNFIRFKSDRKISPLVLAFVSTNFRREIDLRTLFGTGVTVKLLEDKKNSLKLSITSEYEQTSFGTQTFNRGMYNGSSSINTFRGTLWVSGKYKVFDNKVILSHESYYQPSLEEGNNYRWQADLGVEFPVSKVFSFKMNYLQTFESIVIANQKEEDRFLTFGLTIKNF